MNLTNFSSAWLCLGISLGVPAGCAEGEPIADDFKLAVGKAGHGGRGGSLAAGGSSVASGGSDSISSGGSTGVGGSGGSGSDTTDSGSAGSVSGDSGMAGGAVYDGPLSTGIKVEYKSQQSNNIAISLKLTNDGTDMPPMSSLKIRYFMVDDLGIDPAAVKFHFAGWNSGANMPPYSKDITSTCTATIGKLTPSKPMADSYLEFASSDSQILYPKDTVQFEIGLQGIQKDATGDYSYQAGTNLAVNPHLVVLQGGSVVAGMAP